MMTTHHHIDLLLRWERSLMLKQAIKAVIRPGMRVLDAGTGSGVAALWAAQAGAQVVGVDLADVSVAQSLAEANGLADRATFLQSDLNLIEAEQLGGRFDALIAMVYFNHPRLDEGQSRLVAGLCERLLHPEGIRIPDHVCYKAMLCEWHEQDVDSKHRTLRTRQIELEERYGLDFEPLIGHALTHQPHPYWLPTPRPNGCIERPGSRLLSAVEPLVTVDYQSGQIGYPPSLTLPVAADGLATCVLWSQELRSRDTLLFRNESLSWLSPPRLVNAGSQVIAALDERWRASNVLRAAYH